MDMFDLFDGIVSSQLGVDNETYDDVINNKCTYWEGYYIVSVFLSNDENRFEKAKKLFNSKLQN
jgi:hypothetical protein